MSILCNCLLNSLGICFECERELELPQHAQHVRLREALRAVESAMSSCCYAQSKHTVDPTGKLSYGQTPFKPQLHVPSDIMWILIDVGN